MTEKMFSPGETVSSAGVYKVIHHDHRDEHEVTLREGEVFPPCSICTNEVRFKLSRQVSGSDS